MKVYIFGFDQAYAGVMTGLMDIFDQAKGLLQRQGRSSEASRMRVKLASVDGKPIHCRNNVILNVHSAVEGIRQADVFIVTSIHDVGPALPKRRFMVDRIRQMFDQGTAMASICTGAFLLADTGLLDGMEATTHWSMADRFEKSYPHVRLKSDKLVMNHGRLYCSRGGGSSADLAYSLLENHMGHGLASRTAKFFIHDFQNSYSRVHAIYGAKTQHTDAQILRAQRRINQCLHAPMSISALSRIACLSPRTFERRFKKATGDTPSEYIQRIKVASARQWLETTNLSFDEISNKLGYMNSGSFRKIFMRWVGLLPSAYRERYRGYG